MYVKATHKAHFFNVNITLVYVFALLCKMWLENALKSSLLLCLSGLRSMDCNAIIKITKKLNCIIDFLFSFKATPI